MPGGSGFSGAPLPGQYLQCFGDSDEEAPGPDVDTVDEDRVMRRRDRAQAWFDVPAPGGCAAELSRSGGAALVGLGVFPEEPGEELFELMFLGDVGALSHLGRAAARASPALGTGCGSAVLDECGVAYQAAAGIERFWHS